MRRLTIIIGSAALITPSVTLAQDAPKMPAQVAALQACRTKADAAERLACYDKAVDVLSAATASRELVVIDKADVKTARKGLFGFSLPNISFLTGKSGDAEAEADARELQTTIVSARQWNREFWRFTVEDGAVWETTEAKRSFNDPKAGASVTIERGSLGAYYAKVGKGGRVQARRIK